MNLMELKRIVDWNLTHGVPDDTPVYLNAGGNYFPLSSGVREIQTSMIFVFSAKERLVSESCSRDFPFPPEEKEETKSSRTVKVLKCRCGVTVKKAQRYCHECGQKLIKPEKFEF